MGMARTLIDVLVAQDHIVHEFGKVEWCSHDEPHLLPFLNYQWRVYGIGILSGQHMNGIFKCTSATTRAL